MENQASSKNLILNYGLILGVFTILLNLVMYAMGAHLDPPAYFSVISSIVLVAVIVFGIKKFKEANNGFLTWGQAVKIGVGISIVAALIGVIYNYIFITFIEPDFMAQTIEIQNQKMIAEGYTEEQIEAAKAITEKMKNPVIVSAIGIIGSAFGGFIIAAIAGAIMKKTEEEQY